ncbi:MAG: hypothetical protein Q9190_006663 [Brigantiaea leucoxantha]
MAAPPETLISRFTALRTIYYLYAFISLTSRLPFWLVCFLPRALRPHPKWTYKQAFLVRAIKAFIHHVVVLRVKPPMSLHPGKDKNQFIPIKPSEKPIYQSILEDPEIKPDTIGGTWYPDVPGSSPGRPYVIMHLHGGAFVIGDGRPEELAFGSNLLVKHTPARVFAPQYRLASFPGCRFPAALQDVATSYQYLLDLGIPASQIVLSGDSAGGNLAITFLRYILFNPDAQLPKPGAVMLWSPWVDPGACFHDMHYARKNRNYGSDFINDNFVNWGIRAYESPRVPCSNEYISPMNKPFSTQGVPVWIQFGGAEVLADDVTRFAEGMKRAQENENEPEVVVVHEDEYAPHDTFILGDKIGFEQETEVAVKAAAAFLRDKLPITS